MEKGLHVTFLTAKPAFHTWYLTIVRTKCTIFKYGLSIVIGFAGVVDCLFFFVSILVRF